MTTTPPAKRDTTFGDRFSAATARQSVKREKEAEVLSKLEDALAAEFVEREVPAPFLTEQSITISTWHNAPKGTYELEITLSDVAAPNNNVIDAMNHVASSVEHYGKTITGKFSQDAKTLNLSARTLEDFVGAVNNALGEKVGKVELPAQGQQR